MATVVRSFAIQGIDGYPVDIEVKMLEGQPVISIIGLGDQAVKEAAERIQAAIDESGYVFPKKRVIISLAPSDKKKSGSHFDLAMAVGVLCQNGDIGVKKLPDYGFIGELSLDGRLRACRGILPMIISGQKRGIKKIIVPEANFKEASLVHGVEILGFYDLTGVIRYLEGKTTGIETHMEENEKILEEFGEISEKQELLKVLEEAFNLSKSEKDFYRKLEEKGLQLYKLHEEGVKRSMKSTLSGHDIDFYVAKRLVATGHSEAEIAKIIENSVRRFRPESSHLPELEKYAADTARNARANETSRPAPDNLYRLWKHSEKKILSENKEEINTEMRKKMEKKEKKEKNILLK